MPLVVIPLRVPWMPVSRASGIAPSSSVLGVRAVRVTVSLSSEPRMRARGFCLPLVPNPGTGWAMAGESLLPWVPSGSSSSTRTGDAATALRSARFCSRAAPCFSATCFHAA